MLLGGSRSVVPRVRAVPSFHSPDQVHHPTCQILLGASPSLISLARPAPSPQLPIPAGCLAVSHFDRPRSLPCEPEPRPPLGRRLVQVAVRRRRQRPAHCRARSRRGEAVASRTRCSVRSHKTCRARLCWDRHAPPRFRARAPLSGDVPPGSHSPCHNTKSTVRLGDHPAHPSVYAPRPGTASTAHSRHPSGHRPARPAPYDFALHGTRIRAYGRPGPLARIDGIRIAARRPYKSSAGLFTPSVPRLSTCV